MSIVKLPLSNGSVTLVDEDIAKKIKGKRLYVSGKKYVSFVSNHEVFRLHRFVMNNPKNTDVDHINGDTFDNRRVNLRNCSRSENCLNRKNE